MAQLPEGFDSLEPFTTAWAVAGADNRACRRDDSDAAEREAFYAVARAALPRALDVLDRKPLASLDSCEQRLMLLMLSLAHVALAVESQGDGEAKHAEARRHLPITRATADR